MTKDESMTMSKRRIGMLRERGEGVAEVKPVELFFDLVYVLAITQITHYLLDHLALRDVRAERVRSSSTK